MFKEFRSHIAAALVSLAGFLLYHFITSFVTVSQLHGVETRVQDQVHMLSQRIDRQDHKIDRLLLGMCIMDERTCKLPGPSGP